MNRMLQVRIELHSLNENIWGRGGGHFAQSFITRHLLGSSPIQDLVLWHKQSLHAALAWPELTVDFIRIRCPRKFYRTHNYETAVTASASPPKFMLLLLNHLWTYHEHVWQPTWTQGRPVKFGVVFNIPANKAITAQNYSCMLDLICYYIAAILCLRIPGELIFPQQ